MLGDDELARLRARLRAAPGLCPAAPGEERAFWLHDLASTAEAAYGETASFPVADMTAAQEAAWSARLGGYWQQHSAAGRYDDEFCDRYWLTLPRGGRTAGTISVATMASGIGHVKVLSLYVAPPLRRQGLAAAALGQVYKLALECGLAGLVLDALWVRQETLRFYLRRRMWVSAWKHSIMLGWSRHLPRYEIGEDGTALVLRIDTGGGMRPLLRAVSNGTRLGWEETALYAETAGRDPVLAVRAQATLALACAVRGWPLIRSDAEWEDRYRYSDVGGPEGLAYKIGLFEAQARRDGWQVRTPAIPGLPASEGTESLPASGS